MGGVRAAKFQIAQMGGLEAGNVCAGETRGVESGQLFIALGDRGNEVIQVLIHQPVGADPILDLFVAVVVFDELIARRPVHAFLLRGPHRRSPRGQRSFFPPRFRPPPAALFCVLSRPPHLDVAERWFARYGEATVFFSRMLPIVRTFISIPAGVSRMPLWRFLAFSILGAIPWVMLLVWGGMVLGDHWLDLKHSLKGLDYVVAAVLLLGVGLFIWRHVKR